MAGKNVWLTWMASGEDAPNPQEAAAGLTKNGLGVTGGAWPVEVEKHTWVDMASQLIEEEGVDLWVICGRKAELIESERFRYALSLCAAMVRDQRKGKPLQEVIVGLDFAPEAEGLPTLFRSCHLVDGSKGAWAAKVVIAAHGGKQGLPPREEWRLNVIAHQLIGQYLEVGPREGTWEGVMVGLAGDDVAIEQHAVGKRSELPERTVLNYAMEGIKAQIGDDEFVCNAVKNAITSEEGYFLKVRGYPRRLLIGPYPGEEDDSSEVWILDLK